MYTVFNARVKISEMGEYVVIQKRKGTREEREREGWERNERYSHLICRNLMKTQENLLQHKEKLVLLADLKIGGNRPQQENGSFFEGIKKFTVTSFVL